MRGAPHVTFSRESRRIIRAGFQPIGGAPGNVRALTRAAAAAPFAPVAPVAAGDDPFPLGPFSGSADSLLVSAVDGDVVLVSKNPEGLFRSTNGGVTFSYFGAGVPVGAYLSDLTRDPQDDSGDGERIFALYDKKVWVSEDFGAFWTQFGLAAPAAIGLLAVPTSGETLLAAN